MFNAIGKIIRLAYTYEEYWHLMPITEYEAFDITDPNIGSRTYRNRPVQEMTDAGLIVVGQLFPVDEFGRWTLHRPKAMLR